MVNGCVQTSAGSRLMMPGRGEASPRCRSRTPSPAGPSPDHALEPRHPEELEVGLRLPPLRGGEVGLGRGLPEQGLVGAAEGDRRLLLDLRVDFVLPAQILRVALEEVVDRLDPDPDRAGRLL